LETTRCSIQRFTGGLQPDSAALIAMMVVAMIASVAAVVLAENASDGTLVFDVGR
jgi:hypothetical protein